MAKPDNPTRSGRAITEGWLFDRIAALEHLLECYRIGKTPSEALLAEMERTRAQVEYLKEHRRNR